MGNTWIHGHVIIYPNGTIVRYSTETMFSLGVKAEMNYYGEAEKFPVPRRREAVMATRAKHG